MESPCYVLRRDPRFHCVLYLQVNLEKSAAKVVLGNPIKMKLPEIMNILDPICLTLVGFESIAYKLLVVVKYV